MADAIEHTRRIVRLTAIVVLSTMASASLHVPTMGALLDLSRQRLTAGRIAIVEPPLKSGAPPERSRGLAKRLRWR